MTYFSCQALAKELVRSRRAVNRLYENKAQLEPVSMHLGESVGMAFFMISFLLVWCLMLSMKMSFLISGRVILLVNVNIKRHALLLSWG